MPGDTSAMRPKMAMKIPRSRTIHHTELATDLTFVSMTNSHRCDSCRSPCGLASENWTISSVTCCCEEIRLTSSRVFPRHINRGTWQDMVKGRQDPFQADARLQAWAWAMVGNANA